MASAADKSYYRPFLFQAKDEEQADNLADIQAMRMFEGYGAKLLFQRVMETVIPQAKNAQARIEHVRDAATDPEIRQRHEIAPLGHAERLLPAVLLIKATALALS